jgi:hypothetical protein
MGSPGNLWIRSSVVSNITLLSSTAIQKKNLAHPMSSKDGRVKFASQLDPTLFALPGTRVIET